MQPAPQSKRLTTKWLAWLGSALPPGHLRFLAHYLAILSAVLLGLVLLFGWWQVSLPARLLWGMLPLQAVLTLVTYTLAARRRQLSTALYLMLLLVSTLLLGWFLHDSGGHTNPLISLLLVPIAMGAALLPWQATLLIAVAAVALYAGLMHDFLPLISSHSDGLRNFMQLHLVGMWLTFVLSVVLLMGLVVPMATAMRRQRELIVAQREQMLRDERLVAMATFAASAAHQLGTPLGTLALLLEDLQDDLKDQPAATDLRTMAQQIDLCKQTLQSMMRRAEDIRAGVRHREPLGQLLQRIREAFSLLHPSRSLEIRPSPVLAVTLLSDETLDQAILNLLDNAARVSSRDPQIQARLFEGRLSLQIQDFGPGVPEAIRQRLGQPFVSGREGGTGLGLFLSHASIERLGGTLSLRANAEGTLTEILLPLPEIDVLDAPTQASINEQGVA